MDISESAMEAAVKAATAYVSTQIGLPYGARVSDYPDHESLRAADAEAAAMNARVMRGLVERIVAAFQDAR